MNQQKTTTTGNDVPSSEIWQNESCSESSSGRDLSVAEPHLLGVGDEERGGDILRSDGAVEADPGLFLGFFLGVSGTPFSCNGSNASH